ncbi:hypothetical protein BDW59DRAFT_140292 [Aspergillus cavernicola]|uniref:Transcription factor domain-containing protein n=1 Tax=Aspergillus cavernicola TaxID=176166 RepID=A0ABR4IUY0_9EURO
MDPRRTAASGSECGTPAEESIYWSCWKSERELRWELGLPDFSSGLSLGPPQRFPSVPLTNDNQMLRAWYFYLSEISLWRLEAEARKDITICLSQEQQQNGASPHLLSRLTEFSESCRQQLVEWRNSLPLILSISDTEPSTTDTDVLKFVLRGRTTYVNELITWPFIIYALNGREMVPAARALVAKGLDAHLGRLTTNMPGFYHRHHGTWLLIRTSARSACILVAAARTPIRDLLPVGWQEAVEATIEMLYFWRTEVETIEETAIFLRFIMAELGELY